MADTYYKQLLKPLSKTDLENNLALVKNGSLDARKNVILHNLGLVRHEIFTRFHSVEIDYEDLFSIGTIGLIKAVDTFDLTKKTNFSTYAIKCIDNEILWTLKNQKKHFVIDSLDRHLFYFDDGNEARLCDILQDGFDIEENYVINDTNAIIRKYICELPEREKFIIESYFGLNGSEKTARKDLAIKLQTSEPNVTRILNKALNSLRNRLRINGFIELQNNNSSNNQTESKSFYKLFPGYSIEEINIALYSLSIEEISIVYKRYKGNLNSSSFDKLSIVDKKRYYNSIIPKIRRLLTSKKELTNDFRQLDHLEKPYLLYIISKLDIQDGIILFLKYGGFDSFILSNSDVARYLDIDELIVINALKKALIKYREYINSNVETTLIK